MLKAAGEAAGRWELSFGRATEDRDEMLNEDKLLHCLLSAAGCTSWVGVSHTAQRSTGHASKGGDY